MRVSDLARYLVICHEADSEVICGFLGKEEVARCEHLSIFEAEDETEELDRGVIPPGFAVRRYLDRFYVCFRDNQSLSDILRAFYDLIAEDYQFLIDRSRNIDNIRRLLRLLDTTSPIKDKIIADYGCGVGLSLELESEFQIRLVGFDYSARMRKIASERGMRVLSQKDLSCQPEGVFDGAFASYVFQLYPRPCELTDFWRLLKPGAALVANFHKNQGIDFVNDSLKLLRCSIRVLPTTTGAEPHGAYIAYVKNM